MSKRRKRGEAVRHIGAGKDDCCILAEPEWSCTFDCEDEDCIEWMCYPEDFVGEFYMHFHLNECQMEDAEAQDA